MRNKRTVAKGGFLSSHKDTTSEIEHARLLTEIKMIYINSKKPESRKQIPE